MLLGRVGVHIKWRISVPATRAAMCLGPISRMRGTEKKPWQVEHWVVGDLVRMR